MKKSLIIIALVVSTGLVVLGLWLDEPDAPSVLNTSGGPSFEVRVVKPPSARPLFGLIPDGLFGTPPKEIRFDHTSSGAKIASVAHDRLELSADGWEFVIEIDSAGKIAPATLLVFPLELANRQQTLCCRPADRAFGYLRTTSRPDSNDLDGSFHVELANCENAETGKAIGWPPAALTVRGSFIGPAVADVAN